MSAAWGLFVDAKYSDALASFQSQAENTPSSVCYCNIATVRLKLELFRGCIKDCDKSIELKPTNLRAYILKGQASLAMGKKKKAAAAWRDGLAVVSKDFAPCDTPDLCLLEELKRLLESVGAKSTPAPTTATVTAAPPQPPADAPSEGAISPTPAAAEETKEGKEVATLTDSGEAKTSAASKKTKKKKRQAQKKKQKHEGHAYRTTTPALVKFVAESLVTGESFRQKKQLRQAVNVWEQVLAMSPGTDVVCHCYEQMGLAAFNNKQWQSAQDHFSRAAAEASSIPGVGAGEAQSFCLLKQAEACLGMATTSAAAGAVAESILQGGHFVRDNDEADAKARRLSDRLKAGEPLVSGANIGMPVGADPETYAPEEAINLLKHALIVAEETKGYDRAGSVTSLVAILRSSGPQYAALLGSSASDAALLNTPRASKADLQVCLARACVLCGEEDHGIALAQGVLESDEEHKGALLQYGLLADRRLKHANALSVLLRLLVKATDDMRVKLAFTDVLAQPGIDGVPTLQQELHLGQHAGPAYAFLATVVRDCGALQQSAELYELAMRADPDNHNYCLNYVHVLENMAEYQKAFDVMKKFFSARKTFAVSNGLKCGDMVALVAHIDRLEDHCVIGISDVIGVKSSKGGGKKRAVKHLGANWRMQWVEAERDVDDKTKTDPFIRSCPPPRSSGDDVEEVEDAFDGEKFKAVTSDHDMLALYFTLVKVLYSAGCLLAIPPLVREIEPARKGRDLGQTLVRNEHAYYVCISQLLCLHPMMQPAQQEQQEQQGGESGEGGAAGAGAGAAAFNGVSDSVYVCGDSHSLCPSWRVLDIEKGGGASTKTLLRSALVTGLKHWHLRPESRFYPKANFYRVVHCIPDGSELILLFGEIDCREGILLAVEKGRYESLEDGIEVCVDIFISAMADLHRRKGFVMYVHPIVPVLNETRYIVKTYNRILRRRVEKCAHLTWLDFFPKLLSVDGDKLRPEYALDGTHMNPAYLPLLETAIAAARKGRDS